MMKVTILINFICKMKKNLDFFFSLWISIDRIE
jgi:hypothetical protein